ncbi:hypothetical protein P171DRAFT_440670 [Karstenula rhodostoma CBS 690.94]|uniref:Uncharacterized protein n=1 Tax=Karstenula rhodostoma CBS 690.94 TaxID=1392251 RepID=A0A9P4PQE6_9PLEO|nr:hypothetical protein P171DRAFT_440670 [Karstenula rhodostoma CBS 690.94]
MAATFAYLMTILVALIQFMLVSADFDLYRVAGSTPWKGHRVRSSDITGPLPPFVPIDLGWQLFDWDAEPTCERLLHAPLYPTSKDLSHGRLGVRCVGKCSIYDRPWGHVKLVEFHFTNFPIYHATIYNDDGYERDGGWKWWMWGVDNLNYGECFTYDNFDLDCEYPDIKTYIRVSRKFRCSPREHSITAKYINEAYMSEGGENILHEHHGKRAVGNATAVAGTG